MKYSYLALLIIIWWAGAGIATAALFFPVYDDYLVVSIIGWAVIVVTTGLIFFEMKRIKAEDKKKEELKG
jgi:FtsH-binding integral membrane protein